MHILIASNERRFNEWSSLFMVTAHSMEGNNSASFGDANSLLICLKSCCCRSNQKDVEMTGSQ